MVRPSLIAGTLVLFALLGCGGGGGGGSSTKSIRIESATNGSILPGGTVSLTAIVQGDGRVSWSVDGGDTNGTVTASGVYTAPSRQGTFTVRATSGSASDSINIVVNNGIAIALTAPTTIPLTVPRSKLSFTARVTGSSNTNVVWTTTGGMIAGDGTFTAPDAPGTYQITGTAAADSTKKVTTNVVVAANANVRVSWATKGDVVLSLRPDKAPNTVANYVSLVNKGFYDDIIAHRYVAGFVIQWGDPLTKTLPLDDPSIGTGGPGYTIPFEANDLLHDDHVLAMARSSGLDTAGSQVYITLGPQHSLDGDYVVFGAVASGGDIADALREGDRIVSARVEAVP